MTILLAADIGGTKSDLAIIDLSLSSGSAPLHHKRYKNSEFSNLDNILSDFLTDSDCETPIYGCLAVAGVIRDGEVSLTNLAWTVSEKKLQETFGFKQVTLLNDLTAICSALPDIPEKDLLTIQPGTVQRNGVRAVIAPGTGLGEGYLIDQDSFFFPKGSEGGHCDFAPVSDEQIELLRFMRKKLSYVSYEVLCSGVGIPNIFDYLATTGIDRNPDRMQLIKEGDDKTPPIVNGAIADTPCPLCQKTVNLFLEILGSEAGNLALKTYPTGGLFIAGGILPRIAAHISFDPFIQNFRQKEKMSTLMKSFPVHLIQKQDTALLGTISYGRRFF